MPITGAQAASGNVKIQSFVGVEKNGVLRRWPYVEQPVRLRECPLRELPLY